MKKNNNQSDFIKLKVVLTGVVIAAFALGGCGIKKEQTIVTKETESYKLYDVLSMVEDFTIDGKKIGFPFRLEALPEDYMIIYGSDEQFDYESLKGKTELDIGVRNEEGFMSIQMYLRCAENENLVDDGKICYICCTTRDTEGPKYDFGIDGIGNGSTISDAIEQFGEPSFTERIEEENYIAITYTANNQTDLTFISSDGEHIETIYMNCNPD